jgi:hypothetical protein
MKLECLNRFPLASQGVYNSALDAESRNLALQSYWGATSFMDFCRVRVKNRKKAYFGNGGILGKIQWVKWLISGRNRQPDAL